MKDSKEKEHRISNLKDMINNIKDEEIDTEIEDIEEDSELINYLQENNGYYEGLEINDEFIYHPGDDDDSAVNLEESNIDENFIIKTPKESEKAEDNEELDSEDMDEEISNEITESFDNILNAKIGRTPVKGLISTILGLIFIVIAAITFQSRSDKIVDNVISGETTFIFVIFLIIGLLFLIYGLYKVIGLKNPLSNISSSIDSIESDDEENTKMEQPTEKIIPKSNIPLDKESYKIGEFDIDEIKNNLKKPTASKPKTAPTKKNIDDIPPTLEKPKEKKVLSVEEIEYDQAILDNESIDDIFAEVEEIEDIPIISVDSQENKKE